MKKRTWRTGPPPFIGWWNATGDKIQAPDTFSWWNGRFWSLGSQPGAGAKNAGLRAKIRRSENRLVYWSDYYPENARVPRANQGKTK